MSVWHNRSATLSSNSFLDTSIFSSRRSNCSDHVSYLNIVLYAFIRQDIPIPVISGKTLSRRITRGHPLKLRVQHCRIDARKCFFSSRVITIWNQLPAEVLNAVTVAAFVAKLRIISLFAIDFKLYTAGLV